MVQSCSCHAIIPYVCPQPPFLIWKRSFSRFPWEFAPDQDIQQNFGISTIAGFGVRGGIPVGTLSINVVKFFYAPLNLWQIAERIREKFCCCDMTVLKYLFLCTYWYQNPMTHSEMTMTMVKNGFPTASHNSGTTWTYGPYEVSMSFSWSLGSYWYLSRHPPPLEA